VSVLAGQAGADRWIVTGALFLIGGLHFRGGRWPDWDQRARASASGTASKVGCPFACACADVRDLGAGALDGLGVESVSSAPAVDGQGDAVDEASLLGQKESHGVSDLGGRAYPADGVQGGHAPVRLGWAARYSSNRAVLIGPRATALARIPSGPWSTATARVRPSTAALAVA
jgi:hypothetical protein